MTISIRRRCYAGWMITIVTNRWHNWYRHWNRRFARADRWLDIAIVHKE